MTRDLELAGDGVLRAAINTGNRALVQERPDGSLEGVSPALARRLAAQLGARLEPVLYGGAGKVFADAGGSAWDVGFLAIDPLRAERISFTRPYHTIEATYATRRGEGISDVAEVDRTGITVLTSAGSAYDVHLTTNLTAARLERFGTPAESFQGFREGRGDAVAGVRQSLQEFFDGDDAVQILPGAITKVEQAIVLPNPNDPRIQALDAFLAEAIADGFVSRALQGD